MNPMSDANAVLARPRELMVSYSFPSTVRDDIQGLLMSVAINPYQDYPSFAGAVHALTKHDAFRGYASAAQRFSGSSEYDCPFFFAENAPIDPKLPVFDNVSPVEDKRLRKRTFIAEAFLEASAYLLKQCPVSYVNVNDGDVFQDIYPKVELYNSQSQKALGPIYFHKDLANHFVRPDYVNIVNLRGAGRNEVFTTFVRNRDVIENLSTPQMLLARTQAFATPYDELTIRSGKVDVGEAPPHPLLSEEYNLRFFERRTTGVTTEAQELVDEVARLCHQHKKRVQMDTGDFVCIRNNASLHGKDVGQVTCALDLNQRWSMKTVNVQSLAPHSRYLVAGSSYMING